MVVAVPACGNLVPLSAFADYVSKKQNVVQSRNRRKQLTNGFAVFNIVAGKKEIIVQIPRPSAKMLGKQ